MAEYDGSSWFLGPEEEDEEEEGRDKEGVTEWVYSEYKYGYIADIEGRKWDADVAYCEMSCGISLLL